MPERRTKVAQQKNVISLQSVQKSAKLILIEPRTYADAQVIADHLINHRAVVVNIQRMEKEQARRIIDFLSGTVYAINGRYPDYRPGNYSLCSGKCGSFRIDFGIFSDYDFDNVRW